MKRGRQVIAFCLCAVILLGGCGQSGDTSRNNTVTTEKTIQIGMSFDSFVIERWLRDRDAFVKTAKELGADVNVQIANGDVNKQISQIQYFIDKGMDAIVIIAADGSALKDVVAKAKGKGIKIISYDRLIPDADSDLYISYDNETVGRLMARSLIAAKPGGGKIVEIKGSETDYNVTQVSEGFDDEISGSKLSVVYSANCGNWEADQATAYMEEALAKDSDIVGVMCGNDDIATRVVQTLSEHQMAGRVAVVGQDAELSACQRIVENTQTMTVFKQVEDMADIAARMCVDLVNGKSVTDTSLSYYTTETINDGMYNVPYYKMEPVAVTKDNIDEVIIASGFHKREDVYLNVTGTGN